jgi:hypothetical protein
MAAFLPALNHQFVLVSVPQNVAASQTIAQEWASKFSSAPELRGLPVVLAHRTDELSPPAFYGPPNTVLWLQKLGWRNIPWQEYSISVITRKNADSTR